MTLTREQYIAGLRAAADFYETHPTVPYPRTATEIQNCAPSTREEAVLIARACGTCRKEYSDDLFRIYKEVSPGFSIRFVWSRHQICERVKVGEKVIPAYTLPARPKEVSVPEEVVEIYEWKCPESILGGAL